MRALERQEPDTEVRTATAADGAVSEYNRAGIVWEIFDKVGSGVPLSTIENDLNARGVPSPAQTTWQRAMIRKMPLNPAYIGKALSDSAPYQHLLDCLGHHRANALLGIAGYKAYATTAYSEWHRIEPIPDPARIFVAAYQLTQIHRLLNPRYGGPTDPMAVAHVLQRHDDILIGRPDDVPQDWRAFAELWASYTCGFHTALRSYGPAVAHLPLLGGLRYPDFLLGGTVLELKSGRLDHDSYLDQLIKQMITYCLLAHHDGHPVTHVAAYAMRYQRLLRYQVEPLLNRLAGTTIDVTATAADLAALIRASQRRRRA